MSGDSPSGMKLDRINRIYRILLGVVFILSNSTCL